MQIRYNLADIVDISRLYKDADYAKEMGIKRVSRRKKSNNRENKKELETFIKIETETSPDTNSFTDIEYSGFDLNGNRYVLKARRANFKTETPELINMKEVIADFYLKDNTVLTVISEEGLYNNVTLDMSFENMLS